MKKMLSLICIVLISISAIFAQSNYNLELVEKYTREANYYLNKAKEYQKESVYYTKMGDVDRAKNEN